MYDFTFKDVAATHGSSHHAFDAHTSSRGAAGSKRHQQLESQPYCDPEGESVLPASSNSKVEQKPSSNTTAVPDDVPTDVPPRGISALRLDDEQEFPPMAHRSDS
jgi:activator of HSP90 ATPase